MSGSLDQAAAALATDPAQAERIARVLCARQPGDPRPLLILASAQRRQGEAAQALPLLLKLAQTWPQAVRTRYELGLVLAALGRRDEARDQLDRCVTLDPHFRDGWSASADLAFAMGDVARERAARARLARLDHGDAAPGQAAQAIALGEWDHALALLVPWCQARPDDATALQLLAHVCLERGALDDAEALLQRVLALQPDLAPARFDRARLLHIRLDAAGALEALGPLIRSDPDHPAWANLNASCLTMLGDDAAAAAQLARLVQRFPDNPQIRVNHGRVLRVLGAHDEAVAAFRHALAVAPHCGEAWYALANLKSGTLTAADARAMATALTSALDDADRLAIEYALGTWAEQAGDPARAFAHYQRGAALMQQRLGDDRIAHARTGVAHARAYTPALIAARGDWGCDDRAPIFIVGMPRSGSTLVEQILSCHPVIEGTMELPYIGLIAQQVAKRGGPHALDRDQARQLGETYLRQAAVHRRLGRAHFLDKMPGNFMHIGLIRLILPNARIIDVRRHPMATCFSNYRQLFTGGQDYSYDLADLAFAYRSYLHVMRHFQQAAPGFVRTQIHEDLVDDAEGQVRALLAWLDLPFDPATLRFYENDRAVRTVSSEQVRRPIYRSGLDQWRAFEPQLAPLAAGLGDALDSWRD